MVCLGSLLQASIINKVNNEGLTLYFLLSFYAFGWKLDGCTALSPKTAARESFDPPCKINEEFSILDTFVIYVGLDNDKRSGPDA